MTVEENGFLAPVTHSPNTMLIYASNMTECGEFVQGMKLINPGVFLWSLHVLCVGSLWVHLVPLRVQRHV